VVHPPGAHPAEGGRCHIIDWRRELNTDPVRCLVYVLAGAASEQRLVGRTSPGDGDDREKAAILASSICEVDDLQHPRVRGLLASAETAALAMMHNETTWRAIERVAADLQRRGTLTGRDVQVHLREARR
jgi:hypothetical protein